MATRCKHGTRNPEYGGCPECDYEENGADRLSEVESNLESLDERLEDAAEEAAALNASKTSASAEGQMTVRIAVISLADGRYEAMGWKCDGGNGSSADPDDDEMFTSVFDAFLDSNANAHDVEAKRIIVTAEVPRPAKRPVEVVGESFDE